MSEACQRCGEVGEDRRTLWHSCFYAMEELVGVPFTQTLVKGEAFPLERMEKIRFTEDPRFPEHTVPRYAEKAEGKVERAFYTLRVCKECRADWLAQIERWFHSPPQVRESCGGGIFVRELGKVVEITREEWERRRSEQS